MALSDELKSLSVQAKKMTTTIAKLILARSPHGTSSTDENIFDKLSNGLPRNMKMEQIAEFALTSKVILSYKIDYLNSFHDQLMKGLWKRSSNGCIYPLDNSYEKILYVEINEDYKFDSEELLEELRNFSVTHQVFDEMSESILSSNDSEIILFDKLSEPSLGSNIDQIAVTGDDHSLLNDIDEIQPGVNGVPEPVPDFILEMAQATKTTQGNEEMADAHQRFDAMPEPTEQANASQTKCEAEVINNETAPSRVFDELTLPTFIKEMAQAASFVEESTPVSEIKADAKGGFKDNSYLADYPRVFVFDPGVSILHINEIELGGLGTCAKFLGLISGWKSHVNYKEVHSWGKYRSYTQFALSDQLKKVSSFRGDVTKPPILKLCKYSDMLISSHSSSCVFMIWVNMKYVGELECDICPNAAWAFVSFDPGILDSGMPKLFLTTTLEDKGVFRGEEGSSREQTWLLLNPLVLWSNYNASSMRKSVVFLTRVFDPGGLWDALLHSSWCSNPNLGFYMTYLMVCVLDELGNCNTWLPLLSNMSCSRIITMINAFSPGHISVRIALLLNGSSFHLLKENLKVATKCFMKKEVVRLVTIFIFDPGINKPRLVEKRSVAVRCSVGVTSNLVFVYAEILVWPKIYSLRQGYEAARWKLLGRVVFVIEKRAYAIEETREKNSARKDPTISSKFSMFMIIDSLVFDPGGWKYNISLAESATSKFLQTTEIFLSCYLAQLDLLHSSNCADHEAVILVFDPGGYGNGQKVKKQPEACQYGGGKRLKDKRNEDHWIYVFDPGGH